MSFQLDQHHGQLLDLIGAVAGLSADDGLTKVSALVRRTVIALGVDKFSADRNDRVV